MAISVALVVIGTCVAAMVITDRIHDRYAKRVAIKVAAYMAKHRLRGL